MRSTSARVLAGFVVLAIVAAALLALLGRGAEAGLEPVPSVAPGVVSMPSPTLPLPVTPSPSVASIPEPSPTGQPTRPTASQRRLDPSEQAFADAYLRLVETYDRTATDLLIANPLAEFDLVGTQLIELVDQTRGQLADLPPLPYLSGHLGDVAREIGAVAGLLREIDPHGPRGEQATRYHQALDYWTEHVQPASDVIRAALGLPPSSSGDLRL